MLHYFPVVVFRRAPTDIIFFFTQLQEIKNQIVQEYKENNDSKFQEKKQR
jgi:hypothetical protein